MFRLVVVAVVLGLALSSMESDWKLFKETQNKSYSRREEYRRFAIFQSTVKYIEHHNREADMGLHTYWLGVNAFSDLTHKEFVAQMNGYRSDMKTFNAPVYANQTLKDLPATVDWRNKGYVTPIKDQGQCGSCWAFSATGSLEGQHFKSTGQLVSLSEQNLVDCSRKQGNMGCNGGLMDQAFTYIKVNKGIDTESSYPYFARDMKCRFNAANVGATDASYKDIMSESETALQNAVANVGPISVAIDASHPSFQSYSSGVYNEEMCSQEALDHGVLAVGYGTDGGLDYWLVKNSWGTVWGMEGYIMMSRNKDNQCGIATQASYPIV